MADLTVLYPGVTVTDVSTPTSTVTPYGVCYMLIGGITGIDKTLTEIVSVDSFDTLFPTTHPSKKYVKAFFDNLTNTSVRLFVYKVNVTTTPAVKADYIAAFSAINPLANPGGLIIAPEAFEVFTTAADRVEIVTAMDTFCSLTADSYWQGIADLKISLTTIELAITDLANYASARGNISVYAPAYVNDSDQDMEPSAAMAAISLSIWANGAYYEAPAGHKYPIQGLKSLKYQTVRGKYSLAHAANINLIRYFNGIGYVPYDCMTLSTTPEFKQIPSVICFKIVAYMLASELQKLVFSSLKGTGDLVAVAEATINRILFSAWQSGLLVGTTAEDAYDIAALTPSLPDPLNATLAYSVGIRPAYSVIKYRIHLRNLLSVA